MILLQRANHLQFRSILKPIRWKLFLVKRRTQSTTLGWFGIKQNKYMFLIKKAQVHLLKILLNKPLIHVVHGIFFEKQVD